MFEMSIESTPFVAKKEGFHLGTDETLARSMIVERFYGRIAAGMPTVSIALIREGKIVDVFDGEWATDQASSLV